MRSGLRPLISALALCVPAVALAHGNHGQLQFSTSNGPTGWLTQYDIYCERTDASFWAEPINAISNGAFLLAAIAAAMLLSRQVRPDYPARFLTLVLAAIGVGSFLFHTFANRWALVADVLPIAVFIYGYFILAMRRFVGLGLLATFAAVVAFAAFASGMSRLLPDGFLNGSGSYIPALVMLWGVGGYLLLQGGDLATRAGQGLLLAGAVFAVSLGFRATDMAVCEALPIGVHYMWHTLNAVVLFIVLRTAILNRQVY